MLREGTLEEISDGRTYVANDMVKADAGHCVGCHKCCTGMGNSIVLDPFDVLRICYGTGKSFNVLLEEGYIELNVVDGIILPNIKMNTDKGCGFLDIDKRCSIHSHRPGICRMFPLGRIYGENGFKYFLQKDECVKASLAKIKVKKWISVSNVEEYEKYILDWHNLIKMTGNKIIDLKRAGMGDKVNDIAMYILNTFYVNNIISDIDVDNLSTDSLNSEKAKDIYMTLRKHIVKAKNTIR